MSVSKYSKHQRSNKPKFVATDPKTLKVLYSSNNQEEFQEMQEAYRNSLEAKVK